MIADLRFAANPLMTVGNVVLRREAGVLMTAVRRSAAGPLTTGASAVHRRAAEKTINVRRFAASRMANVVRRFAASRMANVVRRFAASRMANVVRPCAARAMVTAKSVVHRSAARRMENADHRSAGAAMMTDVLVAVVPAGAVPLPADLVGVRNAPRVAADLAAAVAPVVLPRRAAADSLGVYAGPTGAANSRSVPRLIVRSACDAQARASAPSRAARSDTASAGTRCRFASRVLRRCRDGCSHSTVQHARPD
jgi:hypothetical protein